MSYQAEYIWIDGTEPTPQAAQQDARSSPTARSRPSGASTARAPTRPRVTSPTASCIPVFTCPDPLRGPNDILVMCEVLNADMTPHPTNTRAAAVEAAKKYASFEPMFGIEQEYTFFQNGRPYGWPEDGYPAPQGPYYCGVGGDEDARP